MKAAKSANDAISSGSMRSARPSHDGSPASDPYTSATAPDGVGSAGILARQAGLRGAPTVAVRIRRDLAPGLGGGEVELALAEPVAPRGATHHVPEVGHGRIPLLDVDERQVPPQRRVVHGLGMDGQPLEVERQRLEVAPTSERHGEVVDARCRRSPRANWRAGPRTQG